MVALLAPVSQCNADREVLHSEVRSTVRVEVSDI